MDATGEPVYIEVKTTTGPRESDVFVSAGEVAFSRRNAARYRLYRVFNYEETTDAGECYVLEGPSRRRSILSPPNSGLADDKVPRRGA